MRFLRLSRTFALCLMVNLVLAIVLWRLLENDRVRYGTAVDRQVQMLAVTESETQWTHGGWMSDLPAALKVAQQLHRPLFMLCAVGDMSAGRC